MKDALAEPIADSCDWLAATASWTCQADPGPGCDWYHGTWQYLRLLKLVSNPAWHAPFWAQHLAELAGRTSGLVSVLVSGCADYGCYAQVAAGLASRTNVTVLDRCATPLLATHWYARRLGLPLPELVQHDAITHRPADRYDLVISDSFLPRFTQAQLPELLAAWKQSLRPGGLVLTTVRIHDRRSVAAARTGTQAEFWRRVATASSSWWSTVSQLPVAELANRVETFAQRQQRTAGYSTGQLVQRLTEAGFADIDARPAVIEGKKFVQIAAR